MTENADLSKEDIEEIVEKKVEERLSEEKQTRKKEKDSDKVSRRDFLKKATGGTAALGAAAMLPSASSFTLKDNKPFKFGNLSSSQSNFEVGTSGAIDVKGNDISNVGSIDADTVSSEVYAKNYDGAGLASKVENALSDLKDNYGGQGRVRITPKDGGSAWNWDKEISFDISNFEGLHIDADSNVKIEYGGSNWVLKVQNSSTAFDQVSDGSFFTLKGGKWISTGSPSGCFQLEDLQWSCLSPRHIKDFNNGSNNAKAIEVRNQSHFSEDLTIEDVAIREADYSIDFVPARVTGGSGTNSFQQTTLRGLTLRQCRQTGIRMRGSFTHASASRIAIFTGADNMIGWELDGSFDESVISAVKFENGEGVTGPTAWKIGSNYNNESPLVNGYSTVGSNWTSVDTSSAPPGSSLTVVRTSGAEFLISNVDPYFSNAGQELKLEETWSGASSGAKLKFIKAGTTYWGIDGDDTGIMTVNDENNGNPVWHLYDDQSADIAAQDLSALSLTSTEKGRIYRHDGANSISADGGTTSSPGYYVWDNSASEFKSIVQF